MSNLNILNVSTLNLEGYLVITTNSKLEGPQYIHINDAWQDDSQLEIIFVAKDKIEIRSIGESPILRSNSQGHQPILISMEFEIITLAHLQTRTFYVPFKSLVADDVMLAKVTIEYHLDIHQAKVTVEI